MRRQQQQPIEITDVIADEQSAARRRHVLPAAHAQPVDRVRQKPQHQREGRRYGKSQPDGQQCNSPRRYREQTGPLQITGPTMPATEAKTTVHSRTIRFADSLVRTNNAR